MSTDVAIVEEKSHAELAEEALDFKRQGHSYSSIAEQMGLSVFDVAALVSESLQTSGELDSSTAAKLDLERIDLMMTAIFTDASNGDWNAIDMVRRLMQDRRSIEARGMPSIAAMFKSG
jgi:hypothetical protein